MRVFAGVRFAGPELRVVYLSRESVVLLGQSFPNSEFDLLGYLAPK